MNKAEAIHKFLSGFGIPAYAESSVPAKAKFPYITYALVVDDFSSGEVSMPINVWYYTDSERIPNAKVNEIAEAIGYGGKLITYDGGAVWIKRGSPWCQSISESERKVKRRYINLDLEYISIN